MSAAILRFDHGRAAAAEAGHPDDGVGVGGGVALRLRATAAGTRLADLGQRSPWRVLFPHPAPGDPLTGVLVNTAGGIVGGDCARLSVAVEPAAAAVLTTQAAEKVYRSAGRDSRIDTRLAVGAGAWLEWLPQETIQFDGARLRRTLTVDAAAGSRLLAAEMVVYGRRARGERFRTGLLHDRWHVRRDGRLIWADSLSLDRDIGAAMHAPAGFAGAAAAATAVYVGDDAAELCTTARAVLADEPCRAAATMVNGLLVVRFLDEDAQRLRRALAAVLGALRAAAAGLPAHVPRVWHV